MENEKKQKANQKIALERIYRLFELANEKKEYAKRYIQIAHKISEKTKTKIPKELKQKHCRKCFSLKIKQEKKDPFLITICEECIEKKKYKLNETNLQKNNSK